MTARVSGEQTVVGVVLNALGCKEPCDGQDLLLECRQWILSCVICH